MSRKRQQQKPAPDPAPDAPSTSISTSGEEQQEVAAVSGRPSSWSKVPGSNTSVDAAVHRRRRNKSKMESTSASERSPLLDEAGRETYDSDSATAATSTMAWSQRNQWIIYAIASGTCAALNGVMAKLTTTELTTSLSHHMADFLGLSTAEGAVEFIVRATFFGLNLAFNGVMWTLFTQALSRGHSTTQVSIMNTSSNFVLTALLGLVIFSESLPPLWWLGASMLVAGNVIIGRKDEGSAGGDAACDDADDAVDVDTLSEAESGRSDYEAIPQVDGTVAPVEKDDDEEDIPLLGDLDQDHQR
ncbi:hypothetical protein RB595_005784 [Gaeumannomyces hyphopodioides]